MGTPKKYKYYLQDAAGKNYYVDANNQVQTTTEDRPLIYSPYNWKDLKIQIGRNLEMYGIFTKSSSEVKFIKDGAAILRSLAYKNDGFVFDAYCKFVIKERQDSVTTNIWGYDEWFSAEVEFGEEMTDGADGAGGSDMITVRLLQKAAQEALQEMLEVPQEIDFDNDAVQIPIQGVDIEVKYKWGWTPAGIENVTGEQMKYFPLHYIKNEAKWETGLPVSITANPPNPANYDQHSFFVVERPFKGRVEFSGSVGYYNEPGSGTGLKLRIEFLIFRNGNFNSPFNLGTHVVFLDSSFLLPGQSRELTNVSFTYNYDFITGDHLVVLVGCQRDDDNETTQQDIKPRAGRLDIYGTLSIPDSTTLAYPYHVLVNKVFNKAFNGKYSILSSFLTKVVHKNNLYKEWNNLPSYTYVTTGDALRGISSAKIKVKIADLLRDMFGRWMASISVRANNPLQFHIEQLPYFFNDTVTVATIPQINNFSRRPATEFLFDKMIVGYGDMESDIANGKFEINSEQTWKLPINGRGREKSLVSPFVASVYEIEYARDPANISTNTSRRQDDKIYLIEAEKVNGAYQQLRYNGLPNYFFAGVLNDVKHYNWGLAPNYYVHRWAPYLKSLLNIKDSAAQTPVIVLKEAKENTSGTLIMGGVSVGLDKPIAPGYNYTGTLPKRLFTPIIYEFSAPAQDGLLKKLTDKPFGKIEFYDEVTNAWYSGFILDVEVDNSTKEPYSFSLLAAPGDQTGSFAVYR